MKLPYVLIVVGGLVIIGSAWWFLAPHERAMSCASLPMKPSVIAFGDSLVAGYGAETGKDFVSVLSESTDIPIQNLGRNGDTTASARTRLKEVIAAKPDIVIVLLGGNDALQGASVEDTERNLSKILDMLQREGIEVILAGVLGGFPTDPYAPMFRRLADTHPVLFVPNILSGVIENREMMSDAIHPNSAGYARIAERLLPLLADSCARLE